MAARKIATRCLAESDSDSCEHPQRTVQEHSASLALLPRVHSSTISKIVDETCEAIITEYVDEVIVTPKTPEEWRNVARDFSESWNFEHVVGAIDGKHIRITKLPRTGSMCFNYKQFFLWSCTGWSAQITSLSTLLLVRKSLSVIFSRAFGVQRQRDASHHAAIETERCYHAVVKTEHCSDHPSPLAHRTHRMRMELLDQFFAQMISFTA